MAVILHKNEMMGEFKVWLKNNSMQNKCKIKPEICPKCGKNQSRLQFVGNECPKCQFKQMKQTQEDVISVVMLKLINQK